MTFRSSIYYCNECKKVVPQLESLLFVENNSSKGFCSEDCIESYFRPLIQFYEGQLLRLKERYPSSSPELNAFDDDIKLLNEILNSPDEVWLNKNELDEENYTYLKYYQGVWFIIICKLYNFEPSYIFLSEQTLDLNFLNEFRVGEKIKNKTMFKPSDETEDEKIQLISDLDQIKSEILAEHLAIRSDIDIPFESFMEYEYCLEETVSSPDEVFEVKNFLGHELIYYIKNFISTDSFSFYYIVLTLKRLSGVDGEINVYPVFSFPTKDDQLFMHYRKGTKLNSSLKN